MERAPPSTVTVCARQPGPAIAEATSSPRAWPPSRPSAARRSTPDASAAHRSCAGRGFDAVGVTLAAPPDGPVLVRGLGSDGRWTPWFEAAVRRGRGTRSRSEATRARRPQRAGVAGRGRPPTRSTRPAVGDHRCDVHLVARRDARGTRDRSEPGRRRGGAPGIHRRASLGSAAADASAPCRPPTSSWPIVHHTVTGNTYSAAQVPAVLRSIQAYHQDVQGCNDIAYNFVGRPLRAHLGGRGPAASPTSCSAATAQGFNTGSVGVVVLGDLTSAAGVLGRRRGDRPASSPGSSRSTGSTRRRRCRFTSAGSAKYAGGHDGDAPADRRATGTCRATSCPGTQPLRAARHDPSAGRPARARLPGRTAPTVPRGRRPHGDGLDRTPSSTSPGTPRRRASGAARDTAAFTKQVPAITGAYRPVVGRLRRQRLRRHRLARHRLAPGTSSGGRGRAAPTARPSTSTARTSRSSATSTATASTTSSGTAPGPAPTAVWYFGANRSHHARCG